MVYDIERQPSKQTGDSRPPKRDSLPFADTVTWFSSPGSPHLEEALPSDQALSFLQCSPQLLFQPQDGGASRSQSSP